MGWFTRFSRFGDFHLVYGQEAQNSCGIASVMMCVFKVNKLKPGKKAVHVETEVYKAYDKHLAGSSVDDGYVYDGSVYTYAGLLADTLNDLNVGKWEAKNVGTTAVAQTIVDSVGKEYVGALGIDVPAFLDDQLENRDAAAVCRFLQKGGALWILVSSSE